MASDDPVWLKDYTPKQADPEWLKNYTKKPEEFKNPIPDTNTIGRHLIEALPAIGSASSFVGVPPVLGTLIGTALKTAAKVARPDLVGEPPQGIEGGTGDMIKEVLLNNTLPWGIGKAIGAGKQILSKGVGRALAESASGMPAVREGMAKEIGQNIQSQIGEHYKPLGDYQPISVEPGADFQPLRINPGQEFKPFRKGQPYQPKIDPTVEVSGPIKRVPSEGATITPKGAPYRVEPVPTVTGGVREAQDKLGKLVTKDKLDASKTLEELTGPNASQYADAMPTDTYQNVKKLLETMKGLQEKNKGDMVLNYSKHKLLWSGAGLVTGGLTGSALGHPIAGALIGGTPMVLNGILDRVMANPETAKLVTLALTTPAKAPQAALINKALSEALPRLFQAGADIAATPDR